MKGTRPLVTRYIKAIFLPRKYLDLALRVYIRYDGTIHMQKTGHYYGVPSY